MALDIAAALGGLGLLLIYGLILALRVREGGQPWGLVDVLLAFAGLLAGSSAFGLLALRLGAGTWIPPATPPFSAALVGTIGGGLLAMAPVLLRGQREPMGLVRAGPRWWVLASVLPLIFLSLSLLWTGLLDVLGLPVEAQALVQSLRARPRDPIWWLAIAYGTLGAPVIEELLFRGFLYAPLLRARGAALAIVGTGLLFGLMHAADPISVPPLAAMGLILAWLRGRSGSLWPCILAHAGNNIAALALTLAV
jgi:membrane protease YdiL (CAAX protease family)